MKVTVHRVGKGIQSTTGIVDALRAPDVKISGKTDIPPGVYRLAIRSSLKQLDKGTSIAFNVLAMVAYVKGLFGKEKRVKDDRANSK